MKLRRLAAVFSATVLALGVAGAVYADSGSPATINAQVSGNTVTVSGDWSWAAGHCNGSKIVGWAVAWGEPGYTDNAVPKSGGGSFYMGDSVQGNKVFTTGTPCSGTSGSWGPLSHTYASVGSYDVCVIIYDIQKDKNGDYVATGDHSLLAGGADRNGDNSVEKNAEEGQSVCLNAQVVVPPAPAISVTKKAAPDTLPAAGGDVTYTYHVTNTGNVALSNVSVTDDNGTASDTSDDWKADCPKTSLAAGESMDCTKTVHITKTTHNVATAVGWDTEEHSVSSTASADVGIGSVQGETSAPTPPPTDSITSTQPSSTDALPILLIVLGVIGLGAIVLTPVRARR